MTKKQLEKHMGIKIDFYLSAREVSKRQDVIKECMQLVVALTYMKRVGLMSEKKCIDLSAYILGQLLDNVYESDESYYKEMFYKYTDLLSE